MTHVGALLCHAESDLPAPAGLDSAKEGNRVTSERSRWNRDSDGVLRMNTQVQLRLGLSELARAIFLAFEGDTLREVNEYGDLTFDHGHATRPDARMRVQDWLGRKGTDALTVSDEPPEIYLRAARALYWQRRPQASVTGQRQP